MSCLGARKTNFIFLDLSQALEFVRDNHSQGLARPGKRAMAFGLEYRGELLAAAIFSSPRTAKMRRKYSTELFRLAFKKDVRIPGGASKIIKNFIRIKDPVDLFTYQDLSGEVSDVYEKSGLTLVEERPKTQVLVRDGITRAEAEDNRKDWFSLEQAVSRGPDSLLGTKLGEILNQKGTRKSNIELFVDHCGYHLEEVPGYRVYSWINKNKIFYTYKITSTVDDFYYIGRHFITKGADPQTDLYYGSGGEKFKNWVKKVGKENLRKEILGLQNSWEANLKAEDEAIGELYRTDEKCLNTLGGFTGTLAFTPSYNVRYCPLHGETSHNGQSCAKCVMAETLNQKSCEIHGTVIHLGNTCATCTANASIKILNCPLHGEVKHQGSICTHCNSLKSVKLMECPIHGVSKAQGENCSKCSARKTVKEKMCSVHGKAKSRGAHRYRLIQVY